MLPLGGVMVAGFVGWKLMHQLNSRVDRRHVHRYLCDMGIPPPLRFAIGADSFARNRHCSSLCKCIDKCIEEGCSVQADQTAHVSCKA